MTTLPFARVSIGETNFAKFRIHALRSFRRLLSRITEHLGTGTHISGYRVYQTLGDLPTKIGHLSR